MFNVLVHLVAVVVFYPLEGKVIYFVVFYNGPEAKRVQNLVDTSGFRVPLNIVKTGLEHTPTHFYFACRHEWVLIVNVELTVIDPKMVVAVRTQFRHTL